MEESPRARGPAGARLAPWKALGRPKDYRTAIFGALALGATSVRVWAQRRHAELAIAATGYNEVESHPMTKPVLSAVLIALVMGGVPAVQFLTQGTSRTSTSPAPSPLSQQVVLPSRTPDASPPTRQKNQTAIPASRVPPPTSERDISGLDLGVGNNATLLLTDSAGRRTGRDPVAGRILQEIPRSAYGEDAIDNDVTGEPATETTHLLGVFRPAEGEYDLLLTGLQTGPYELSVRAFSRDGADQPPILEKGNIQTLSSIRFRLIFSATAISTLTRLPD